MQQVTIADDLAVAIGNQTARLSPGEAFRLAERLIRRATVRMVEEEVALADAPATAGKRTRITR